MSIQPDNKAALNFLRLWASDGPWVLTAIQTDRKKIATETFYPKDEVKLLAWLAEYNGIRNLYFQVNPPLRAAEKKASRENIKELAWLHVDIDPRVGEDLEDERARCLALFTTKLPKDIPPPTAVIFSGGGYQGFWKLREPFAVNGDIAAAEQAKLWNLQLERVFGGDHCHNVDRIMRLPGSINVPDEKKIKKGRKPTLATLVSFSPGLTYGLEQFSAAAAVQTPGEGAFGGSGGRPEVKISGNIVRIGDVNELAQWNVPDRVKVILVQGKHPDEPKEDNSRSSWVFDACCQLVRCGVPDDVIFSLLTDKDYGISESILEKGSGTERYAIRQIERAKACVAEPWLQEMNEKYACISAVGSKFRIARHVNGVRVYQTQDDFKKSLANEFIQVPGKDGQPVLGSKVEAWLRAKHRRSYETVQFAPGMETKDEVLNTWEGWPTDPVPADAKCDLFLEVTREIICGGDSCHFNWTMDWLAHLAQRPHEPGQIALILRGAGGLGKSFWAKRIGELVAPHFAHLTRTEHIFGKFNASVAEKLLVFGDEIFASGDKRMNAALKRLVTEETLPVERKGLDVIEEPRFFRFIVATNEAWALPTDLDDRRLCVFDVGEGRKNDHTFFRATAAEWANGGRDLFFQMLCERDISRFNHRDRPVTKALTDQKLYSLRGPERIVFEMLWAGAAPIIDYRECPSPDPFTGKSRECFISTLQMAGDKVTNKALSKQLARVSTEVAVRHRNVRGAWLKPLPEARAAFCASFNLQITWPQDDGQWANTELQPDMLKAVR